MNSSSELPVYLFIYVGESGEEQMEKESPSSLVPAPDQPVTRKDEKRRHRRGQQTEPVSSPFGVRLFEFRRDFAFRLA